MRQRERLGSRLGFILLSAGCAIGIGNVWKFPYMAGRYGGGAFVLFYMFFLIILGLHIMTIEFAVGRASQKSPVRSFNELEKEGMKWHLNGILSMAGNYLLMMSYTSVAGWMLHYFCLTAAGRFEGASTEQVAEEFTAMLGNPFVTVGWMVVVVLLGFGICSVGLQNGLERVTKVMMIALLAIMIVLAVHSFQMDGISEALAFYLKPDFARMLGIGVGATIVGAMTQAFFTLSLGIGAMAIFGSYIGKGRALLGEAVNVAVLDTFVAITSGLIIFPACFSFGVAADSGPRLIFITLPNIFNHLPLGRLWGSLFFVFMSFAAFSTVLAVFENIISCGMDVTHKSRKQVAAANMGIMILLSLPCVLGYNLWSGFMPFGEGSAVLDLEDFVLSNLILPIGSLGYLLFCTSRNGWGWDNFMKEANEGGGMKVKKWMRFYCSRILPVIILFIFVWGIIDKFN